MKYQYTCPHCKGEPELITKSLADIDRIELCPVCACPMQRQVVSTRSFFFKDSQNYVYNPAFGTYTRTKRDVSEQIRKLEGETGRRVEAVGDAPMPDTAPRMSKVDMQDAAEHLRQLSKAARRKGLK